jgi:hypothetical protein
MDKARLYLFLAERLPLKVTLNKIYQRFEDMYSRSELEDAFDELANDKVLNFVYNPYPSTFCDICGDEVGLESNGLMYSGFHICEKIDKTIDEIDEYEIITGELLKAISNDFGNNIVSVDQAKIKLRQYLKEGELYEFIYDKSNNILTINGDDISLQEGSQLANSAYIVNYYFNLGIHKVDIATIEDDINKSQFFNISKLSGDISKLNQKIRLETGLQVDISVIKGFLIIR